MWHYTTVKLFLNYYNLDYCSYKSATVSEDQWLLTLLGMRPVWDALILTRTRRGTLCPCRASLILRQVSALMLWPLFQGSLPCTPSNSSVYTAVIAFTVFWWSARDRRTNLKVQSLIRISFAARLERLELLPHSNPLPFLAACVILSCKTDNGYAA